MKPRNMFLTLMLLITALLASCAPQATQPPAPAVANPPQAATGAPAADATSRGDKLEATAPATVALASGGVQLVEFFRFT